MRVDHQKKSDGVESSPKEKERWGESSHEKKSNGVRVHHEKEQWGESLP